MSTTAATFFGNGTMVFVAGAPRANGTGQVVLYTKFVSGTKQIMDVKFVISGEQFASSFGYEIATADLNGDKCVFISIVFYSYYCSSIIVTNLRQ